MRPNHNDLDKGSAIRVVFSHPSYGELVYVLEEDLDSAPWFFAQCRERARGIINPDFDDRYTTTIMPTRFYAPIPQEIFVIAVGVSDIDLLHWAKSYFGELQLDTQPAASSFLSTHPFTSQHVCLHIVPQFPSIPDADLKECWKRLLFHTLLQSCLAEGCAAFDGMEINTDASLFAPTDECFFVLEECADAMKTLCLRYFSGQGPDCFGESAFLEHKYTLLHTLRRLSSATYHSDPAFLAAYYQDLFLLGMPFQAPHDFFSASCALIREIQYEDLAPYAHLLTSQLSEESIELMRFDEHSEQFDSFVLCSNQEPSSFHLADCSTDSFYTLHLTEKEKDLIHSIVTTIANNNIIELAFHKSSLEKKGDKIHSVHPLRFIGYILSDHELRSCLKVIKKSSFKWSHFISGFAKRMKEELANDNLYAHVPGFAQQVHTSKEHVHQYIHKRDWEGLVKSLM